MKRFGVITPDDMQIGSNYVIYKVKNTEEPMDVYGQSFNVKAINLPFIVGKLNMQPKHPPITLDARFVEFMGVDEEFVKAQVCEKQEEQEQNPLNDLFGIRIAE